MILISGFKQVLRMWKFQKILSALIVIDIFGLATCGFVTVVGSKTLRIDEPYKGLDHA